MHRLLLLLPALLIVLAIALVTCESDTETVARPPRPAAVDPDDDATSESGTARPRRRLGTTDDTAARDGAPATVADETGRHVLVVDAVGRGIPGIPLEFGPESPGVVTDSDGRAPTPDGATLVSYPDGRRTTSRGLPDVGDVVLRLLQTKPLEMRVLSEATGRPVDADIALVVGRQRFEIPTTDGVGTLDPSPVQPEWTTVLELAIAAPQGLMPREGTVAVVGNVAPLADRVRATIVLREAVTIPVRVVDWDGRPVARARRYSVYEDTGYARWPVPDTDADGRTTLGPVPFVRGTRYVVRMGGTFNRDGPVHIWADSPPHELRAPGEQPEVVIRLPADPPALKSEDATPREPERIARAPLRARMGQSAEGRVNIRVLDVMGQTVEGVAVELTDLSTVVRGTDATGVDGAATISSVAPGTYIARVIEPGFPADEASVTIDEAGSGDITLRRVPGARLRVRVLDEEGERVPFAPIGLWVGPGDVPHPHVVDGAQELQPYTDALGEITFTDVGPLPWAVYAEYGSRAAQTLVTERVGEVVIRLER